MPRKHVSNKLLWIALVVVALVLGACTSTTGPTTSTDTSSGVDGDGGGEEHYTIALNLSYTGNDWQDGAANLIKAAAATAPRDQIVDLRIDIAGPDATKQNQMINQEVAAGVDAIIIYPISPTALNAAVKKACDAGVIVHAYDSIISEPCAYNVFIDQSEPGRLSAQWLADELGGEGNIAVITGVPGTTVDTLRTDALAEVLAQYPNMRIAGSENGEWAQAQGLKAFRAIEASAPDIDGIWAEAGCYSITDYLVSSGRDPLPCAGEGENGHRLQMLPESEGGYGARGITSSSTLFPGELAFLNVMRLLQGDETVPKVTVIPTTPVTNDNLKLGSNPADGANVFPAELVPPGFFTEIWSPLVEQGIQAALTGKPDKISEALPCSEVPGCIELDEIPYNFDE